MKTKADANLQLDLQKTIKGDVDATDQTREFYSHDASLFEVKPAVVAYPKDAADVQALVKYVAEHKPDDPELSITARSAGTDMSGGAVNESIVADFNKYFKTIYQVTSTEAHAQPGVFYRDFEVETLKHRALMPSYPASRDLCTIGGMVNNNSGGEKSLEFGKTEKFVNEIEVVLADGSKVKMGPISRSQLQAKMKQKDFEGEIYRKTYALVDRHDDAIKKAKPHVTKNSTGYKLWDVWDRDTGIFNLSQAIIGAQGRSVLSPTSSSGWSPTSHILACSCCSLKTSTASATS